MRSELKTAVHKRQDDKPPQWEQLPSTVGVGNGMVATWMVGLGANQDDLLRSLRESPFDAIIVQSVPGGYNDATRRALAAAVAESKLWDGRRVYAPHNEADQSALSDDALAALLAFDKSVHEMMSNTFAVVSRKKVRSVGTVEYALTASATQGTAVADNVLSRSRWGQAQFGTLTVSFQTTKQRMTSIKFGVVYRQGDWEDQQ